MRANLLFLLCFFSCSLSAAIHEDDEHRTSWAIKKEEQIFDPSPNCEKARNALQADFRKLLSRDPECKSERLFLTFKKKEIVRTQSLMMRAKAGVDVRKACDSWLGTETKRLRSTFLYGSCRPPLPSAKSTDIAAIGLIISLPSKEKLDLSRSESFYSSQVKVEGDELSMQTTKKYLVSFEHSIKSLYPNPALESSLQTVQKLCKDWRELALKKFSKELSGIEGCSGACASGRCCTCFAGGQMIFQSAVQGFSLYKRFDAPSPQKAVADCQGWLKEMQNFNSAGYVTGRCSEAGFWNYAKDGGHILRSRGVSYQFQSPGG